MNGPLCGRKVEVHQTAPHLFHRNPFGLVGLRMGIVDRVLEPGPGTASKLLGAKSGYIYEKKAVRDQRGRLHGLRRFDDFSRLWRFKFHNGIGYRNLRRQRNPATSGIRDWGLGIGDEQGFGPN